VQADLVDCIVALPGQLFYGTAIPVCLWFVARNKNDGQRRDRRTQTLFIDARQFGMMIDRTHRELLDADIARISDAYHAWRGDTPNIVHQDLAGFCASVALDEIATQDFVLIPGRYVGAAEADAGGERLDERIVRLKERLYAQLDRSNRLQAEVRKAIERIDG